MADGICKLTEASGQFVRSHLIPQALTKPAIRGNPLIEFNSGSRPKRRWTSWFDDRLVTKEGEQILSRLDDWAIKVLRKRKLIWSGWGSERTLMEDHVPFGKTGWGIRKVEGIDDPQRLRLFYLSILWRAAATDRPEFSEVTLPSADMQMLRRMLLEDTPSPLDFYPTTLTQLSTRGPAQNLVPLAQEKRIQNLPGLGHRTQPIFRFYFDGLIAHVVRQATGPIDELGPMLVGANNWLTLSTVTYETSFQYENLVTVLRESRPFGG